ncbi:S9 family peptidase [Cytophagaceae bacterium YF14B1]|uniref:Proline-specific endopeptidase n=1 Tax=Xanthocytophaga flava TaxID=3048013 RepID=A0AAE3QX15_9BACT|nr:S9 family peptidase [Xanthocytophaga flavus]MDJ1484043.1 S9 family peptidase [Xanthocytophaga flavus]
MKEKETETSAPHFPDVKPPIAEVKAFEVKAKHGASRTDNYYWLNKREDPNVIKYLEAENAYTDTMMADTKVLQDKLFEEIKGRIKEDDESVPYKDGNYYYYTRFEKGGEYPIYCRKKGSLSAPEEVIINANERGHGHNYYSLGGLEVSDNEELVAFGEDTVSRRNYILRVKNLKTGEIYPDAIPNTEGGSYAWAADNKTLFYIIRHQQTLLGYQVWRHVLGTDPKTDVKVYEEKDDQFYMGLYRMKSKKYIAIACDHNGVSTEYRLLDANKPTGEFTVFLTREHGHEYNIEHYKDKFYVRTNWQAENFRLMEVPEGKTADKSAWKEVIPHRADVYLDGLEVFVNHLVLQERKEGLINIRVINQKSKAEHYINFGEPAYTAYTSTNPDFNTDVLRYGYTSMTTPPSTFDYNMDTKEAKLMKQQEVVGGYNKEEYVTERVYATARDGVKIPISIVYKKGFEKNGQSPLYQYSYGSYGYSTDPTFSVARLSLLNRGFAFAICHIRGGQEMGRQWYDNGKMLKKKNTFTDFIDCSEFLIKEKYTSTPHLYANGGSAGGLLMGAVANMAPDKYNAIIADVPFVDVVTTMLDESIPLTTGEYEEWGNPNEKEYYDYMLSYSPYDNVEKKAYPNMLVTTGLHDSQVQYWEPAKWVAKLRTLKTDNHVLLLKTNMEAGHGGASGRFKAIKETAFKYAFIFKLEGIKD